MLAPSTSRMKLNNGMAGKPKIPQTLEKQHKDHPIVFFDIHVEGQPQGRIKFELFSTICPKTCENFRQFCTGQYKKQGKPLGYKSSLFFRLIKDFFIQGGDFINQDGTGSASIYGSTFRCENFTLKHDSPYLLSTANLDEKTNGCQFFITFARLSFLDNQHTVFGRVIEGFEILRKLENLPVDNNDKPTLDITIDECGEW